MQPELICKRKEKHKRQGEKVNKQYEQQEASITLQEVSLKLKNKGEGTDFFYMKQNFQLSVQLFNTRT